MRAYWRIWRRRLRVMLDRRIWGVLLFFILLATPLLLKYAGVYGWISPLFWRHLPRVSVSKRGEGTSEKLAQLQVQILRFKEILAQFRQLRVVLSSRREVISAQVVWVFSPSPFEKKLYISAGEREGVRLHSAVLVGKQVVGRVEMVYSHLARVALLGSFKISVRNRRTRQTFILQGEAVGKLVSKHLQFDADVREGDVLVATGWEGCFPPGALVGRVKSVQGRAKVFLRVEVEPFHSLTDFSEVFVLPPISAQVGAE
ncbi:MAG: rod shape-determining protein MreC [Planctomycetota bacterium]|nr:MAG: rod shape-determining protein MreC [Planctomycetota bacterium]